MENYHCSPESGIDLETLAEGNQGHRPYNDDPMFCFYGTDGLEHFTSRTQKAFCGIDKRSPERVRGVTFWAAVDIIQQGIACNECLQVAVRLDRETRIAYTKWLLDE